MASPKAANKIRNWFSRERRSEYIESGRDDLTAALRRADLPVQRTMKSDLIADIADEMNYVDLDALLAAIGEGHVSPRTIVNRVNREYAPGESDEQLAETIDRVRSRSNRRSLTGGVHVEGLDDLLVRLATCCTPVPGDDIVGFVTRGRGVSVHRSDCSNALSLEVDQSDRLIEVDWDDTHEGLHEAAIEVDALDRPGLLSDVSGVMSGHKINVRSVETTTGADRIAHMKFTFEFADPSHLETMLNQVRSVESVYDAYRVLPGGSS